MQYTQTPTDAFEKMQMNAGIIVDTFDPETAKIGKILGATSGGIQFQDSPSYTDLGEDVDNCPKNTAELKRVDSRDIKMGGTFVTVSAEAVKGMIGTADLDGADETHIIPRDDILETDFQDLWFIGDYSDKNTGTDAGFLAIHIMKALNTDGFQFQSGDKAKGQFAFNYTAHYSLKEQGKVPYEVYVKAGKSATGA